MGTWVQRSWSSTLLCCPSMTLQLAQNFLPASPRKSQITTNYLTKKKKIKPICTRNHFQLFPALETSETSLMRGNFGWAMVSTERKSHKNMRIKTILCSQKLIYEIKQKKHITDGILTNINHSLSTILQRFEFILILTNFLTFLGSSNPCYHLMLPLLHLWNF